MQIIRDKIRQTHHFFTQHAGYTIAIWSLLAIGMMALRVRLSYNGRYLFLVWNLILAWIPYLCALSMAWMHRRAAHRWWALLPAGTLWLIFFPNAPYILTDFLHLSYPSSTIPFWYDASLLIVFSWTGLLLGLISLRTVQTLVQGYLGRVAGWLLVLGVMGLSGIGIYLGRFLRWNSWDLFFRPGAVLADVAGRMLNPVANLGFYIATSMVTIFLLAAYLTLTSLQQPLPYPSSQRSPNAPTASPRAISHSRSGPGW